jgi:DNA (cytosine-5)-methyltransferase 1
MSGISIKEVDVLIGGPPCQGFSTVGNRMIDDPRNNLVREFARAVGIIRPSAFVMENVVGLVSMKNGLGEPIVSELLKVFEGLGYKTYYKILVAADYGVPQLRKRLFFVGFRKDLNASFLWPRKTHHPRTSLNVLAFGEHRYLTVRDAISDLPRLRAGEEKSEYELPPQSDYQRWARAESRELSNHRAPKHSDVVLKRIRSIPPGGNHSNLPDELKLESGFPNIYGRLSWDEPADTITANFGCASAPGRFIHPEDDRVLSVREGARLQSFPDRVKFFGSLTQQYRQVGNAVPPLLAKAVATSVRRALVGGG